MNAERAISNLGDKLEVLVEALGRATAHRGQLAKRAAKRYRARKAAKLARRKNRS